MGHVAQPMVVNADLIKTMKCGFIHFLLKMKKFLKNGWWRDFVPANHSRICGGHVISLDYYPSSRMLSKTFQPSVDFLQHLQKVVTEWRQLKRKTPYILKTVNEGPSFLKNIKLSPIKSRIQGFYSEIEEINQNTKPESGAAAKKDR